MSIADKLTRLSDARDDIITSLGNKGIVATDHGFEDFPADIDAIVSGSGSAVVVTDTLDSHGGTIREITAVSLEGDTVTESVLGRGYKAHNALGEPIVGTADISGGGGGTVNLQTKSATYTPTESQQTDTITADSGYDGLEEVDVTVNAISPTYVGSDITRRSSSDLSASGATVTVPAGYYSSQASKAVSSGTAGTPTATKGTVSNHSVSVTPSVTNTTGYITGSTKTGAAVTVSASELVSGSETKTENGTYDVTNLASLVVNVSGGGSVSVETKTTTLSSVSQTIQFTSLKGTPKYWFLRTTSQISSSSTTYYYIVDIRYNGTNTTGNSFRLGSTRRIYNITSGLSYTYSNGTLTVTAGSSASSSPGQFYNGGYELVYIY